VVNEQVKEASAGYQISSHSREGGNPVEAGVPLGYKKKEVGTYPEDWNKYNIGRDAKLKARIGWQALTTKEYKNTGKYFLVTGTDFNAGSVDWDSCCYVSKWRYKQDHNIQLKENDVLVTKDGTIGKVGLVKDLPLPATLNSGVFVVRSRLESFESEYLFYILTSDIFDSFIKGITAGSTITHLYQKDFVHFNFYGPIKSEQTTIANALSDVDALIISLEKLITKKLSLKTATMQQLLTGKKRLPPFDKTKSGKVKSKYGLIPEDWSIRPLKTISTMYGRIGWQGLKQEEFTFNDRQPFLITGMNFKDGKIRWNEVYHIAEDRYELDRNIQLREGDILMTKDGTIGKLLFVDEIPAPHEASLNSHLLVFRPVLNSYDPKYLYYVMKAEMFSDHIDLHKSGSTFFGITQEAVGKFDCLLPGKKEQEAVSQVLSDMDDDIEALEQRFNKIQQLKQGMMQELLTGKIRLL
jgi:type I restriction enzyme S subunit